ncbi:MAG: AAA family ATPase [Aminobacteriaceae bacterium]
MLEEVSIKNVGGISFARLCFGGGFTAITGESGAGKSSLVRALELIGGARSQTLFIRSGEDEASVEGVFFEAGERGRDAEQYTARRTLSKTGRNRCFYQQTSTPFSAFSSLMNQRIKIQSQFAQMELLDLRRQMDIVDFCGGSAASNARQSLGKTFDEALRCDRDLKALRIKEEELKRRYRDAEAIVDSIRPLNIVPGCDTLWEKELEEKSSAAQHAGRVKELLLELTGGASGDGLLSRLECSGIELIKRLSLERSEPDGFFNEGLSQLHAFIESVGNRAFKLSPEALEQELASLEKKLGTLRKAKRATGTRSVQELLSWTSEARDAILWMREAPSLFSELQELSKELRRKASSLAMELRALRLRAASSLEEAVNIHLYDLGMADNRFSVRVSPLNRIRSDGADDISFTLSTEGSPETPVNKTASGGELSRILLALQLSLPDETLPSTLVFDEVEAGLGGRAALLAGYKLLALSKKTQVLLVTHEATIAALADHHFRVRKTANEVEIQRLNRDERISEVARMLSGDPSLQEAREHAERLLLSAGTDTPFSTAVTES